MTAFREVPRHEHKDFFSKAEGRLGAARAAADMGAYSAAVSNCVHSAISAVDAMTVLRTGRRSAGRHPDALNLARSILVGGDRADLERQYLFLTNLKNPAEYESTVMTDRQAADALKCAERILAKVRAEIAK